MANLYPVIVDWIPGLPQIPYRNGIGEWEGVVMHQTANPNDTARSERAYEASTFQNAFVHEFIDPNEIIQVANPDYMAYGAGSQANPRFIHLELCSANSQDEFNRSFDRWCQRAAYFLSQRSLGVIPAKADGTGTLWSHDEVSRWLGGTTHTDPIEYLASWGKTWQDVIDSVQEQYTDIVTGGNAPMLSVQDANVIIAFLSAAYNATQDPEARAEFHRLANELRKASGQPLQ
ncbi:peptidoglycan recognition protein family protein [Paenibacillus hexagrammi]|uniref:N-acetylmuramoyl-L-alanine amidase n=1 Tax=Paenibacillus hexagrammi TaxID=2908839 RepID=A0ABY3SNE9_9BACL|nr:N-acetylmuramoyl-L-alanine amidase [Paenibacillus sp. YPD9-1]UJF35008.1 N-acetylmuramoyl-L-alanine amidase [Paenibacillus sp. YPD9-1]